MFNNKKDPLVDAVKGIMEASAREREIERKLNESLGITSKKALPHELHSEYDAVLKESIAGSQINEVSEKLLKRAKQKAKDNAMVAWELNDKKAEDKNEKRAEKFSAAIEKKKADGKKPSLKKKKNMKEALDPVGEEDDDVDNDGKKNTKSDKYLKHRRKVISKKMDEEHLQEKAPPGKKYERMVKHIKKGYEKDGLTKKEKSIAYATAWKAKNKEKMDESNSFNLVQEEIRTNLLERIRHIYESEGADAANAYFETLSEEERGILGEQSISRPGAPQPYGGPNDVRLDVSRPGASQPSYNRTIKPKNINPYSISSPMGVPGTPQPGASPSAIPRPTPQTIGSRISGFFKGLTNVGRTPSTTGMGAAAAAEILGPAAEKTGVTNAIRRVNKELGSPLNIADIDQPESQKNVSYPGVTRSIDKPPRIRDAAFFKSPITDKYKYDYTTPDGERTNGAIEGRYAGRSAARVLTRVQQKRVEKSAEVKQDAIGAAADAETQRPYKADKTISNPTRPVNSDREEDQTSTATAAQPETQASTPAPRPVPGAQTATAAQPETQASTPAPRPVPGAQTATAAQPETQAASTDSGTSPMARPASAPRPARPAPTSDWKKDVFDSTKIGGA